MKREVFGVGLAQLHRFLHQTCRNAQRLAEILITEEPACVSVTLRDTNNSGRGYHPVAGGPFILLWITVRRSQSSTTHLIQVRWRGLAELRQWLTTPPPPSAPTTPNDPSPFACPPVMHVGFAVSLQEAKLLHVSK